MNDFIFKIKFSKFTLFNFYKNALAEFLTLRIRVILFIQDYCKTLYNIKKLFDPWDPDRDQILNA